MGLVKIFGKVIQIGDRDLRSNKDFDLCILQIEKDITKAEKTNDKNSKDDLFLRGLAIAFTHQSVRSAFWWLRHIEDNALNYYKLLHIKFKRSLETEYYGKNSKKVHGDNRLAFVSANVKVLGNNFDYSVFGGRISFIFKILESYDDLLKSDDSMISSNASPFLTFEFWLYREHKRLLAEGRGLFDANVIEEYNTWFTETVNYFNEKYLRSYTSPMSPSDYFSIQNEQ